MIPVFENIMADQHFWVTVNAQSDWDLRAAIDVGLDSDVDLRSASVSELDEIMFAISDEIVFGQGSFEDGSFALGSMIITPREINESEIVDYESM